MGDSNGGRHTYTCAANAGGRSEFRMRANASALTSLFAAPLGAPVVKVAAFSYGVPQALSGRGSRRRGR